MAINATQLILNKSEAVTSKAGSKRQRKRLRCSSKATADEKKRIATLTKEYKVLETLFAKAKKQTQYHSGMVEALPISNGDSTFGLTYGKPLKSRMQHRYHQLLWERAGRAVHRRMRKVGFALWSLGAGERSKPNPARNAAPKFTKAYSDAVEAESKKKYPFSTSGTEPMPKVYNGS